MPRRDIAQTAGNHDRLVITAHFLANAHFIAAEISREIGAAEFIVERRTADRSVEHDLQRRGNTSRFAHRVRFPRLLRAGNAQIGDRKSAESRFRFCAASGGTFITDLTAGAG